ncbi:MAG: Holliday junction branch migration protein RuvA [bacterium]
MIAFLRGNIIYSDIEKSLVILDVGGVGYEIFLPVNPVYFSQFSAQNDININKCTSLFIYTYVREDRITLYGFSNFTQRELFSILLDTKDIGPKLAVTILSNTNADDFINLILTKNIDRLSLIKGIGKLTAERIISGLKNKIIKRFNSFKDVEAISIGNDNKNNYAKNKTSNADGVNLSTNINVDADLNPNQINNNKDNKENKDINSNINNIYSSSSDNDKNSINAINDDYNKLHRQDKKSNIAGKNIIYETALALNALGYSMADSIELAGRISKEIHDGINSNGSGTKELCEINTENLTKECLKHIYQNKIS